MKKRIILLCIAAAVSAVMCLDTEAKKKKDLVVITNVLTVVAQLHVKNRNGVEILTSVDTN